MTVRVMPLFNIRMLLSVFGSFSYLGVAAAVAFPNSPPNAKFIFMGLIKGRLCEIAFGFFKVLLAPAAFQPPFIAWRNKFLSASVTR